MCEMEIFGTDLDVSTKVSIDVRLELSGLANNRDPHPPLRLESSRCCPHLPQRTYSTVFVNLHALSGACPPFASRLAVLGSVTSGHISRDSPAVEEREVLGRQLLEFDGEVD